MPWDARRGRLHSSIRGVEHMQIRTIIFAVGLAGVLAACGETVGEQAIVGGAAGAGTSLVLDGDIVTGAAVGAAGNVLYCQRFPERCS